MESVLEKAGLLLPKPSLKQDNIDASGVPADAQKMEEQQRIVFQYLMQLEKLKETDPEGYASALKELGITGDTGRDQLSSLNAAVKAMRSEDKEVASSLDGFQLPGEMKTPGIEIVPDPGFTIKTKHTKEDSKIFINLCSHNEIAEPAMKKRLDESGQEVEGLNIPMSVGPGRPCTDKAGEMCVVFDIIVSPSVLSQAKEDATGKYRDFVCQLAIQSAENKHKMPLDYRYKLPKGLKYIGQVQSQMIQDRKKMPKIEEVKSSSAPKLASKPIKSIVETFEEPDRDLCFSITWEGDFEESSDPSSSSRRTWKLENDGVLQYSDPMTIPPPEVSNILLTADIEVRSNRIFSKDDFDIKISAFKASIKITSYKMLQLYFPCAVDPMEVSCNFIKQAGSARWYSFALRMKVDNRSWDTVVDPGSKNWLVAVALGDRPNPYAREDMFISSEKVAAQQREDDELPEDRFQIKMPKNINKYTGLPEPQEDEIPEGPLKSHLQRQLDESMELPEDKFHKRDASSAYIINQREQAVKDKWDKHEKEKAERASDPNVEYIDVDDFKPGGKYGPPQAPPVLPSTAQHSTASDTATIDSTIQKASSVIAESVASSSTAGSLPTLSSNLWMELLD